MATGADCYEGRIRRLQSGSNGFVPCHVVPGGLVSRAFLVFQEVKLCFFVAKTTTKTTIAENKLPLICFGCCVLLHGYFVRVSRKKGSALWNSLPSIQNARKLDFVVGRHLTTRGFESSSGHRSFFPRISGIRMGMIYDIEFHHPFLRSIPPEKSLLRDPKFDSHLPFGWKEGPVPTHSHRKRRISFPPSRDSPTLQSRIGSDRHHLARMRGWRGPD